MIIFFARLPEFTLSSHHFIQYPSIWKSERIATRTTRSMAKISSSIFFIGFVF